MIQLILIADISQTEYLFSPSAFKGLLWWQWDRWVEVRFFGLIQSCVCVKFRLKPQAQDLIGLHIIHCSVLLVEDRFHQIWQHWPDQNCNVLHNNGRSTIQWIQKENNFTFIYTCALFKNIFEPAGEASLTLIKYIKKNCLTC